MTKAEQLELAIHKSILMHIRAYQSNDSYDSIRRDDARKELKELLNELFPESDNK